MEKASFPHTHRPLAKTLCFLQNHSENPPQLISTTAGYCPRQFSPSIATSFAMAAPLIWINGFPGAGKLTVARELGALDERIKVIDNHQLIDPVEARFSRSQPEYQPARKQERQRAFAQWVLSEQHLGRTIVFTGTSSCNFV